MTLPTEHTTKAWIRLFRTYNSVFASVETALKDAGQPPLSWYDVMLELERVGDKGLRPFELQDKLLLPQYGVSRLLERIEKAGYLERFDCEDDGRGLSVKLTDSGKEKRKQMWPVYAKAIEASIGSKLSLEEVKQFSKLLEKIV